MQRSHIYATIALMIKKVYFLSFLDANYSRSSTILNAESEYFEKKFLKIRSGFANTIRDLSRLSKELKMADYIVIMSPCHILTIFTWLFTRKPVVLDAGWPLIDGILSRGNALRSPFRFILTYFIDLFSFHTARKVIVETALQSRRTSKVFFVPMRKIEVIFTGLNELAFQNSLSPSGTINQIESKIKFLNNQFVVIFRGRINREAGFENILQVANELEKIATFIFVIGKNDLRISYPSNVIIVNDISFEEMALIYKLADVALGQLSNHSRLRYTIPHKAFEAGFFSRPYVTFNSRGIRELYDHESSILLDNISPSDIKSGIYEAINKQSVYSSQINTRYEESASQVVLNLKFEKILKSMN